MCSLGFGAETCAGVTTDDTFKVTCTADGRNFQTVLDYTVSDASDHGTRELAKITYLMAEKGYHLTASLASGAKLVMFFEHK